MESLSGSTTADVTAGTDPCLYLPKGWRWADRWIIRTSEAFLCLLGLTLPVMISVEVAFRYVLNYSLFVVDSLAIFMLVWLFMLGGGLALRRHAHVGLEFFLGWLPTPLARVASVIGQVLLLIFLLGMFWSGCSALPSASRQMEGALGIRLLWVMLSFPVGFLLLIYHQVTMFVGSMRRR